MGYPGSYLSSEYCILLNKYQELRKEIEKINERVNKLSELLEKYIMKEVTEIYAKSPSQKSIEEWLDKHFS